MGKVDNGKKTNMKKERGWPNSTFQYCTIPIPVFQYSTIPIPLNPDTHLTMFWNGAFLLPSFPDLIDLFQEDKANMHAVAGKISFGIVHVASENFLEIQV